jgi:RsmE family RNA methyltransferase
LYLNRFLFDPSEVENVDGIPTVQLSKDDYRTLHAAKTLSVRNGDTVRAGIVSSELGLMTDEAVIQWMAEGNVKKTEVLKNGNPPGSMKIRLYNLEPVREQLLSPVSLILALPRPIALGRILPMIAQMGVNQLVLTEARKVPRDYFGTHLFRKPELLTERLVEGLCQAGDVILPRVTIVRHLAHFLNDEVDQLFPRNEYARAIAHPQRLADTMPAKRMRQLNFPNNNKQTQKKVVVAIGPEGGWTDPEELERFLSHGFEQITMGTRVLRSDCAVVSLLSLAHDVCNDAC